MKFGTQVDKASMMIFSYRAISDSTCEKNGGHFQNGLIDLYGYLIWVSGKKFKERDIDTKLNTLVKDINTKKFCIGSFHRILK